MLAHILFFVTYCYFFSIFACTFCRFLGHKQLRPSDECMKLKTMVTFNGITTTPNFTETSQLVKNLKGRTQTA
jgi:hypothetical protein